jgi:hypothetical protein
VFPSSGERRETPALFKGPNRLGVSLPSPEDGNRLSFRNIVFRNYLEFWMMDATHKASVSECV